VLVIAAGFGFGSVMQTSSSSTEEPTSAVIDDTRVEDIDAIDGTGALDETPGTRNDSGEAAGTSATTTGLGNGNGNGNVYPVGTLDELPPPSDPPHPVDPPMPTDPPSRNR
jgi:hypothetical protein